MPHRRLLPIIEQTNEDYGRMPFFVRPMVKAGLRKRTGHTIDEWKEIARQLAAATDGESRARLLTRHPDLIPSLERLAEHYRTAPDRAARGMKGAALEQIGKISLERERTVRELIAELR